MANNKRLGSNYYPLNGPNAVLGVNAEYARNIEAIRNRENAPYASLDLDFTRPETYPNLSSFVTTFTRTGNTATYINKYGYITSALADTPRFDYDPVTLAPRGLLIEGTATNRATRSDDFNTTVSDGSQWSLSGMTRTDVSMVLPNGSTGNACNISGNGSLRSQAITVTASTVYTFSFWAKNNSGTQARYRVWNVTAGSSIVDYTVSGSNYVSQLNNSTWTRISVTFTVPAGCTSIYVYPVSSDTTGTNVYLFGAQVELGNAPSSYIATGTSVVSRAPDTCILTAASSWFTGGTTGTFLVEWYAGVRELTSTVRTVLSTDDVSNKHLHLQQTSKTGNLKVASFGATTSVTTANTMSLGARVRGAFAYSNDTVRTCLNGGTVATGTGIEFSSAPSYIVLGAASTNGTTITDATVVLNGCLVSVKYFPFAFSSTVLQSLTA